MLIVCSVECVTTACVEFLLQQLEEKNAIGFLRYARAHFLPRYLKSDLDDPKRSTINFFSCFYQAGISGHELNIGEIQVPGRLYLPYIYSIML
jgi:hypothetical protein